MERNVHYIPNNLFYSSINHWQRTFGIFFTIKIFKRTTENILHSRKPSMEKSKQWWTKMIMALFRLKKLSNFVPFKCYYFCNITCKFPMKRRLYWKWEMVPFSTKPWRQTDFKSLLSNFFLDTRTFYENTSVIFFFAYC